VPLQFAAIVRVEPEQLCMRQPVLADQARQAPAPLQVPSLAQLPADGDVAVQRFLGSASPEATAEQAPTLPETLQLRQRPLVPAPSLHAVSQQTPSVQKPEVHWLAPVHGAPLALSPHEPVATTQVVGAMQSPSVVQLVRQASPAHLKLPQERSAGVTHIPMPLHDDAGLAADVDEQLASRHRAPVGHLAQAPPWQRPVVPHVFCTVMAHMVCGSMVPSLTVVQTPMLPCRSHETQAVLQAELQHTPWAQCLPWHSASSAHSAPNGFRPHEPFTQTLPGVQSPSFVHFERHFEPWQVKGLHVRADGLTH